MQTLNILERVKFDDHRPVSQALFQGPGPKVMLVCLKGGQKVPEHAVPVEVIVQAISGHATFYDGSTPIELKPGTLLRLDASRPHAVEAIEDTVVMATILTQGAKTGAAEEELDLRPVPRPQRHPLVFAKFDSLVLGDQMVLVNDHDPKPLHMQFDQLRPGEAEWSYIERGPALFRIRIVRTGFGSKEAGATALHQRL